MEGRELSAPPQSSKIQFVGYEIEGTMRLRELLERKLRTIEAWIYTHRSL